MSAYEYRVIPAPRKGEKAKGIKTPDARMAQAMETRLNAFAEEGWEYVRSDVVPMEERAGLTSKTVSYHTVLIFRREADFGMFTDEKVGFGTFAQEDADAAIAAEAAKAKSDADAANTTSAPDKPA
ncbi:DUF4177 domain-containing protein [Pacificibacter marinus]|uniref:DUF4177 domain-containing protein n=1 Tax=Pacificibacter marinus TaxID=658057 RepID=A0A1Y5SH93_9RHOB|nr:DUF4177 domain-containing protein [Pacificibacter marinus]SEK63022.1 protein of unknown function [Pacificibacter marinus]SLN40750.1 hypothetical protein PAM7971_01855 [Pacificibacter marinus]